MTEPLKLQRGDGKTRWQPRTKDGKLLYSYTPLEYFWGSYTSYSDRVLTRSYHLAKWIGNLKDKHSDKRTFTVVDDE